MVRLGNNLKVVRELRGLDRDQLAERVGVKPHCMASYENGMRVPTVPVLSRLQEELQVGADLLLGSDLKNFPKPMVRACLRSMAPRKAVMHT